jgi:hypothetical protein
MVLSISDSDTDSSAVISCPSNKYFRGVWEFKKLLSAVLRGIPLPLRGESPFPRFVQVKRLV